MDKFDNRDNCNVLENYFDCKSQPDVLADSIPATAPDPQVPNPEESDNVCTSISIWMECKDVVRDGRVKRVWVPRAQFSISTK